MNVALVSFELLLVFNLLPAGMLQMVPSSRPCTMDGRFEINDGTCQKYYFCIYDGATFVSYDLNCAGSTVFNPLIKSCVPPSAYVCTQTTTPSTGELQSSPIGSTSSSNSASTSSSTAPTSSSAITASTSSPTTASTPSSTTASTSSPTTASTPSTTTASTPSTTTASTPSSTTASTPSTTTASTPSSTTASTPSSTTASTPSSTAPSTTTEAPCLVTGRFPILTDPTCQKYYFCYVNGASVIRYNMKCPNRLVFNPNSRTCVLPTSYSCPKV